MRRKNLIQSQKFIDLVSFFFLRLTHGLTAFSAYPNQTHLEQISKVQEYVENRSLNEFS
jgi:hypothetical protein